MTHLLTLIWTYIQLHEVPLLALVGGAGGLSVAIQRFLHKFKVSGAVLSFFISHVLAGVTAVAAYVLDAAHPNAGVTWGWLWLAAQFWHRLIVNPAYNKYVLPFLDWLAKQKQATRAAQLPIPTATTEPQASGAFE